MGFINSRTQKSRMNKNAPGMGKGGKRARMDKKVARRGGNGQIQKNLTNKKVNNKKKRLLGGGEKKSSLKKM